MRKNLVKTDTFLERAKLVHNNKYNYSLVKEVIDGDTRVDIICPKHGVFNQTAKSHLKGAKCKECSLDSKRTSAEEFIKRATILHNNKYDYSNVTDVKNNAVKVHIICPAHGDFYQSMNSHLTGSECPICGRIKCDNSRTNSINKWLIKVRKEHGDKYDYSLVEYKSCHDIIKIICPIHGVFEQKAYQHTWGNGCRKCNINQEGFCREEYSNKFLQRAPIIHDNFYDYSKVDYKNAHTHVIIGCPIHGEFFMQPYVHLDGSGCKHCFFDRDGFRKSNFLSSCKGRDGLFYVIICNKNEEEFMKVGITSRTVKERCCPSDLPYKYTSIYEFSTNAEDIWNLEKRILREYKNYRHIPSIDFAGKTECLNIKIKEELLYDLRGNEESSKRRAEETIQQAKSSEK